MTPSGIVIVDTPAGLTSHDVVHQLRKLYGTRKVGHAGTLDPMATGVLVIGIKAATRLLGHLSGTTKEYQATIRLGASSTTDDREGELGERCDTSHIDDAAIYVARESQLGTVMQVPSSVSAKRVDGKRAHALARSGEHFELEAAQVRIDSFEIQGINRESGWIDIDVNVVCSSGTFIRAIARDLGSDLGVGGHLIQLRRTRVGPFTIEDSVNLNELMESDNPSSRIIDMGKIAKQIWPHIVVSDSDRQKIAYGQRLAVVDLPEASLLALLDGQGALIALARVTPEAMEYRAVFIGSS